MTRRTFGRRGCVMPSRPEWIRPTKGQDRVVTPDFPPDQKGSWIPDPKEYWSVRLALLPQERSTMKVVIGSRWPRWVKKGLWMAFLLGAYGAWLLLVIEVVWRAVD